VRVWIDTEACMGAGVCEQIEPLVFYDRGDGLWAVRESADLFGTEVIFDGRRAPDGSMGVARVPVGFEDRIIQAAEDCPGECIYLEP